MTRVSYKVNDNHYHIQYYLADGIYPSWSDFVKTICKPTAISKNYFLKYKRLFGRCRACIQRLTTRFRIVDTPYRLWNSQDMHSEIIASILHNIIVEVESEHCMSYSDYRDELFDVEDYQPPTVVYGRPLRSDWVAQRAEITHLHNRSMSGQLQAKWVDPIRNVHGDDVEM